MKQKVFRTDKEKRELIASHEARDPALTSADWHKQRGLFTTAICGWKKQLERGQKKRGYTHRTPEEKAELIRSFQNKGDQTDYEWKKEHQTDAELVRQWIAKLKGKPAIALQESREIVQKSNGIEAELKMLRVDVHRLKYLVAELSLDKAALLEKMGRV
jgi:hypothetical protein